MHPLLESLAHIVWRPHAIEVVNLLAKAGFGPNDRINASLHTLEVKRDGASEAELVVVRKLFEQPKPDERVPPPSPPMAPSSPIDTSKLEPAWVLMRLFNAARPLGLGKLKDCNQVMTLDDARAILKGRDAEMPNHPHRYDFDYLGGRPLKINLLRQPLEVQWYERDQGHGNARIALGMAPE